MNSLNKFLFLFVVALALVPNAYSKNADPGIAILMSPASVDLDANGVLTATVGNYGNQTIAANSLRVTISVGADAEILGIATAGSDSRWTVLTSLLVGPANTIRLTNSGGGFGPFDVGDIVLDVTGIAESGPDVILGNIVYITAANPLLCQGASCPSYLNASQGNARNAVDPNTVNQLASNDNSSTSLAVTTADTEIIITGQVFYDYTRLFDDAVNGLKNVPANIQAVLVKVEAGADDEVMGVVVLPITGLLEGSYEFAAFSGKTYYVMLTKTTPLVAVGDLPPSESSLASGYFSTGESIGLTGSDSEVDGKIDQFTTTSIDLINVNFGIIRFTSVSID
jgi:hypothetical protein